MHDKIRQLLFQRADQRWQSYERPGFLTKIMRLVVGSGHAPIAIFLTEHAEVDWEKMLCCGSVVRAWKKDESGCSEVSPAEVDSGEEHGQYWDKQLMRFHISPDCKRVMWNDMEGPHLGQLIIFSVPESAAGPKLKLERVALGV